MMQRTANENAACQRRICKRSDQPKIERLINNDARLILRGKLNGVMVRFIESAKRACSIIRTCVKSISIIFQKLSQC